MRVRDCSRNRIMTRNNVYAVTLGGIRGGREEGELRGNKSIYTKTKGYLTGPPPRVRHREDKTDLLPLSSAATPTLDLRGYSKLRLFPLVQAKLSMDVSNRTIDARRTWRTGWVCRGGWRRTARRSARVLWRRANTESPGTGIVTGTPSCMVQGSTRG